MEEVKTIINYSVYLYHVHLRGNFAQTGFGFSCMKKASELNVNGYLRYLSAHEVEMNLEGKEKEIEELYKWCLASPETKYGEISAPFDHFNDTTEFNIVNSI